MIDIRHVSQQVELTFWSIAIESMIAVRRLREKISLRKFSWQWRKDVVLISLALSGLGMTVGFIIGFMIP